MKSVVRGRRLWESGSAGETTPARRLGAAILGRAFLDVAGGRDPSAGAWLESTEGRAYLEAFGLNLDQVHRAIERKRGKTDGRRNRSGSKTRH